MRGLAAGRFPRMQCSCQVELTAGRSRGGNFSRVARRKDNDPRSLIFFRGSRVQYLELLAKVPSCCFGGAPVDDVVILSPYLGLAPYPGPIRSRGENMIDRLAAPAAPDVEPIHTQPPVLGGCPVDRYSAKASPAVFSCFPHSFQLVAACPAGGRNPHLPFSGDAGPERVRAAAPTRSLHCTSRST